MFKIGSQLFTTAGSEAVTRIANLGRGVFLDLKFHDIPTTVAGAVRAAAALRGVRLVDLHALGGREMMQAGVKALSGSRPEDQNRPSLLAVTILTSLNAAALRKVGIEGAPASRTLKLARLAKSAGVDGVVASAHEVRSIRRACGKGFLIVVPGIRPRARKGAAREDQARVATPAEAIRAGADYIVVGRPITAAADPRAAAQAIVEEIAQAQSASI